MADIYGYEIRDPNKTELQYFNSNPHVSGMAAEDNRIILNPYSKLSPKESKAVGINEAVRLYLRQNKVNPDFELTPEQKKTFTNYSKDPIDIQHTIIGRIISGDPSVGKTTKEQAIWADWMHQAIEQHHSKPFDPEGDSYDYQTALKYGVLPDKETMHWQSREPKTGQILKGRRHPTFKMEEEAAKQLGYEIFKGKDGRYYEMPSNRVTKEIIQMNKALSK